MPYIPTDWKDRAVDKPMTYTMQDNGDGTITLIPAEGNIAEVGTPLTAANLNHIEAGILAAVRKDETTDMNKNLIQNVKIKLPINQFASVGSPLDINNSDIIGLNSLFWADTLTGDSEAMLFPRSLAPVTPVGSITPADYDALRVLDGTLYLNSKPIGSVERNTLWTGAAYFTDTQTYTPSKPLSKCANGWAFVWSDFDAPSTKQDWDWQCTLIPKNAAQYNMLHTALIGAYATATQVVIAAKTFQYTDTTITGTAINSSSNVGNNNADVCLRMVVEF